jgi:L-iditol 2-dehydrogenase
LTIDPYAIHYREVSVTGSFGFGITHFRQALEEITHHRDMYESLISHVLPLEDYAKAFQLAVAGECMKIVFRVRDYEN